MKHFPALQLMYQYDVMYRFPKHIKLLLLLIGMSPMQFSYAQDLAPQPNVLGKIIQQYEQSELEQDQRWKAEIKEQLTELGFQYDPMLGLYVRPPQIWQTLSCFVPGLGQYYNQEYWKIPVLLSTYLFLYLVYNNKVFSSPLHRPGRASCIAAGALIYCLSFADAASGLAMRTNQ